MTPVIGAVARSPARLDLRVAVELVVPNDEEGRPVIDLVKGRAYRITGVHAKAALAGRQFAAVAGRERKLLAEICPRFAIENAAKWAGAGAAVRAAAFEI